MLQDMSGACKQNLHYPLDFLAEKRYTYQVEMTWACSSVGSASVSLLCPTELWAFKWGVCRLVAQPRHAPKYGPIAQLGERSVRIREVKGSNPSRSTILCKSELNLLREALFRVCFYFRGCGSVRILFFRCIRYSLARLYLSDVFFLTGSIDICCANCYN